MTAAIPLKKRQRIVAYVAAHPEKTYGFIAQRFGVSREYVSPRPPPSCIGPGSEVKSRRA